MHAFIYYLHNGNDVPFYVGHTHSTENRLKSHKERFGLTTQLEIIETVNYDNRMFWEKHYMHLFISWGFALINKGVFKVKSKAAPRYNINYSSKNQKQETLNKRKEKILIIKNSPEFKQLLELIRSHDNNYKESQILERLIINKKVLKLY